jgi:RNA-directed DNA polymerase
MISTTSMPTLTAFAAPTIRGRFILAWKLFGYERRLQALVVNYADDLVICCCPGKGQEAMEVFRSLMTRLGLAVNERKSRLVKLPEESFDFLGYTN